MRKDEVDITELVKKYKKFEESSYKYFKEFREQIKSDRDFLAGEHYSEKEDAIFGKKRYKGVIDVTSNVVRSTVNQYSVNPYAWHTNVDGLDQLGKNFSTKSSVKTSVIQALRNSVAFGLGFLNNTTVMGPSGIGLDMYSIADPLKVMWDPDSTEIDGSDATQCIIIDLKSKDWVRRTYGEEYIMSLDRNGKPLFDISECYEEDKLPLITYYVKDIDHVTVYKLLCSDLIDDPIELPINRLPIVPVYGEEIFKDNKVTYRGIVSQTRPIQLLVDMAYGQLCERLSKAPKTAWIATKEAIEGYEEYYKNFDKSVNPLVMFKKYDSKKQLNEKPERVDCSVRYDDLANIISSSLNLIQNITGVSSVGIPDERVEITATEAILNEKSFATNIRNYFDNLKASFKACGDIFYSLSGYGNTLVEVVDGPEDEMSRECARQQLSQMVPALTSDTDKRNVMMALMNTYNGTNQYISAAQQAMANTQNLIPPEVQQQITTMQGQLKQAEENAKAILNENNQLQTELIALQNSNETSLRMKMLEIESNERIKMAELQLKYSQSAEKNQTELVKTEMNNESEEKQKILDKDADMQKEIMRQRAKADEKILDMGGII